MANGKTWLLIADSSKAKLYATYKARFFTDQSPQNLELLSEFTHDKSRMKSSGLVSDKRGEFGSGTFGETRDPKTQEAALFASMLAKELEEARIKNMLHELVIVAPPEFMGMLKKHMTSATQKLVLKTIEKDYTQQNDRQLVTSLLMQW